MSDYSEFFLNRSSHIIQLETLEISHSNFSQSYFIVRNYRNGVTVTLENSTQQFFQYYPLRISLSNQQNDLDQKMKIELGDLGSILPLEIENITLAEGFNEKPKIKYRGYRSDDLTTILYGPILLEIVDISFNKTGCIFEAKAPRLNITKIGELYKLDRFPALRGFL